MGTGIWNCQTVGKLNLLNRDYARNQRQLYKSGEVRIVSRCFVNVQSGSYYRPRDKATINVLDYRYRSEMSRNY